MRTAVLISGRGSNLQSIVEACEDGRIGARLTLVLCNKVGAGALEIAARHGIATRCIAHGDFDSREAFDLAMLEVLREHEVEIVALAGFMRILSETFIREYYGSLLNIHPSLLPKYPGLNTHQRALDAGDREAGASVHFVIPELDAGPTILRAAVPIEPHDDASSLAARVLEVEHQLYPRALAWLAEGRLSLRDGAAWMDGVQLGAAGYDYRKAE